MPDITITPVADKGWDAFPEAKADSGWEAFPEKPTMSWADTGKDVVKSLGTGVGKGIIGLAGMAGDITDVGAKGIEKASNYINDKIGAEPYQRPESSVLDYIPNSNSITHAVEDVTGDFYQPKSKAGEYAQSIGEFMPAAIAGPGGVARKLITNAIVPAVTSQAAGDAVGEDYKPLARAAGGLVGGIGGAVLSGPNSVESIIRRQMPNIDPQDIARAGQLIQHGAQRGIQVTWPEAISRVTGQPVLTDIQRILESHSQTRPVMQEYMAGRPQQVENAVNQELNYLGGRSQNPSMIGPEAARSSEQTINNVRAAINRATRPSYDAAGQTLVPQAIHAQAMADPLFARTLHEVRNNPEVGGYLHAQSDRSVAVYDAVKQQLEQRSRNLAQPTNPNASAVGSSLTGSLANDVRGTAVDASRAAVNGPSHYERALGEQARLRHEYLEPLQNGAMGRLADSKDTKAAISAIFGTDSQVAGSENEIRTAITALAHNRPAVAEQLVRAHVEMTFNQAAKDLVGGGNQFGGAKFVKELVGDSQNARNLRASIESLPNGQARWQGTERLLDILAATGQRQPKGSLTAFNSLEAGQMSGAGLAALAAKGASPGKWMSLASDTYKSWSMGRNLDQLVHVITDPASGPLLQRIAAMPRGSREAAYLTARLIGQIDATSGITIRPRGQPSDTRRQ